MEEVNIIDKIIDRCFEKLKEVNLDSEFQTLDRIHMGHPWDLAESLIRRIERLKKLREEIQ